MRAFPYENEAFTGTAIDAAQVSNLLNAEGIDTVVAPPRTGSRTLRAVYVLDAADLTRARAVGERYARGEALVDAKAIRSWRCPRCNELREGQFAVCWQCGHART
jgi:hypothetical protein